MHAPRRAAWSVRREWGRQDLPGVWFSTGEYCGLRGRSVTRSFWGPPYGAVEFALRLSCRIILIIIIRIVVSEQSAESYVEWG